MKTNISASNYLKEHKHSKLYKYAIFLFIISLGMGEVVSIMGIKLSYITAAILFMVFIIENKGKIRIPMHNRKITALLKFCIVLLIYASVQVIWSSDFLLFISSYRSLFVNVFILVMIILYIDNKQDWLFINKAFIVLICINLIVGTWEVYSGSHIVSLDGNNAIYYQNKPVTFYINGNDYATLLVYGIYSILINIYLCSKEKKELLLNIAILAITIWQIIVIDARGATYSMILLFLIWPIIILLTKLWKKDKLFYRLSFAAAVIFILLIIVILFYKFSVSEIIYEVSSWSSVGNYKSDMFRVEIFKNGMKALFESFGFGVGAGQSILASNINLHNFYFEILVEYGVFVGGYFIISTFSLFTNNNVYLPVGIDALIKSYPIVMVLLGISSSGAFRIRGTWILFALLYILKFSRFYSVKEKN